MIEKILNFLEKFLRTDVRYVLKGYFWFVLEHGVSTLAGIASAIVFANFLAPQTYGVFKYVLSLLPFLGISTFNRINDSISVSVARGFEGDVINALKTKMKWGLLGSLAGLFVSAYYYLNANAPLGTLILIAAIFVPLFNPPLIYSNFLTGKKQFKIAAILNSLSSIIYEAAIIAAILLSKNVFIITLTYFTVNSIIRFGALAYALKNFPPNDKKESMTIKYGIKLNLLEIMNVISTSIDNILVFHYIGAAELAAYTFIKKVPENLKFIPRFLTSLSAPKFSAQNIGDPYVKKEVVRKTWIFYSGMAFLVLAYILAAPFIFELLFKPYKQYVFLSQIYALSFAFNFGGLFLNFIETNRKAKTVLSMHFLTSVIGLLIILISIKFYGLLGLVSGYSLNRLVSSVIRYIYFKKETRPGTIIS